MEIVQAVGIILGMAVGATYIPDAYGNYKQLFYNEAQMSLFCFPNYQMLTNIIIYGFLPFLSIYNVNLDFTKHILLETGFELNFQVIVSIFSTVLILTSLVLIRTLNQPG